MKYKIDTEEYNVIIEKKNNKNLYIRVKSDLTIHVTTNYLTSKLEIKRILDNNHDYLIKMINKQKNNLDRENYIYYFGKKYELVFSNLFDNVELSENKIYVTDKKMFDKWYKKEMETIFSERYEMMFNRFTENIPRYRMRIRKMTTRWGVCNIKSKTITLNSKLIEYDESALDYVIAHELSHLIHFNHSKDFWNLVSKYIPNYKEIRRYLKE